MSDIMDDKQFIEKIFTYMDKIEDKVSLMEDGIAKISAEVEEIKGRDNGTRRMVTRSKNNKA
tara:strand:- start:1489 stop:1674 length:186 start_codon:yes stop_codon:yes gene_type:complete